jgi:ABC-type antimicrobial peptide transport system permease subunit
MLTDSDPYSSVIINESAAKAFGWHDPVGKTFSTRFEGDRTVKGVVMDVNNASPTKAAEPVFYFRSPTTQKLWVDDGVYVLFKYREGMWDSCKAKIEGVITNYGIDIGDCQVGNAEGFNDKHFKSEQVLLKLLYFVLAVCVIICVFGFVSLVSQTCAERRKSIAIRKIYGATADDILAMFAKEYFGLLMIGAVIAFTAGYFIMQLWLERYVRQTTIPLWIYLSILIVMALVIVLCVGWQVYRVSIERPAEVIKSE